MKIDLQLLFLYIGLLQCILIAIFSLTRRQSSSFLLSAILMVFGLLMVSNIAFFPSYFGRWNTVLDFAIPEPIFLIGPLTYFYSKSLFEKDFQLEKADCRHFIPVLLDVIPSILAIIFWSFGLDNIPWDGIRNDYFYHLDSYAIYVSYLHYISLATYLYLSWKFILPNRSISDNKTYRWSRDFLIGISLIVFIWTPYAVLSFSKYYLVLVDEVYFHPVFYTLSAFVYFLSYRIIKDGLSFRPNLFTQSELHHSLNKIETAILKDGLYRNPELTLKQLSTKTDISEKKLSFIFKHHFKKGFNQYVNECRIQKVFKKLQDESSRFSIEGIALDVGFSSRSTFYRSFKQVTGKSPKELLRKQ